MTLLTMATERPQQVKQPPSQKSLATVAERECRGVLPLQLNTLARAVTSTISENNPLARVTSKSSRGGGGGRAESMVLSCFCKRRSQKHVLPCIINYHKHYFRSKGIGSISLFNLDNNRKRWQEPLSPWDG